MSEPEPVINDRRRIDPKTGAVRPAANSQPDDTSSGQMPAGQASVNQSAAEQIPVGQVVEDQASVGQATEGQPSARQATSVDDEADSLSPAEAGTTFDPMAELRELVDERTADLQRLQAEYANYKKRVDRDRDLARQHGIDAVVRDLLPVLDAIEAAREHGELDGGFKLVADELEKVVGGYGLSVFGVVGEPFDPMRHDALMQMPYETEVTEPTISAVIQRGVMLNDRVLRPARVGVANP